MFSSSQATLSAEISGQLLSPNPKQKQIKANLLARLDHPFNNARRVELPGLPDRVVEDFTARHSQAVPTREGVSTGVRMSRNRLLLSDMNNLVRARFEFDIGEDWLRRRERCPEENNVEIRRRARNFKYAPPCCCSGKSTTKDCFQLIAIALLECGMTSRLP